MIRPNLVSRTRHDQDSVFGSRKPSVMSAGLNSDIFSSQSRRRTRLIGKKSNIDHWNMWARLATAFLTPYKVKTCCNSVLISYCEIARFFLLWIMFLFVAGDRGTATLQKTFFELRSFCYVINYVVQRLQVNLRSPMTKDQKHLVPLEIWKLC